MKELEFDTPSPTVLNTTLVNSLPDNLLTPAFSPRNRLEPEGCVLVIDDEQSVLDLMRLFLEPYGIKVKSFTNPFVALAWYEEHWRTVDLVFLDMKNPFMDGEFCFALLQSVNSNVRVALMSGSAEQALIDELLEEGALKFFPKPFHFPTVIGWATCEGMSL